MARPKSSVEDDVFDALRAYEGQDIVYPATLRTLYAVRNAVYRFNKDNERKFRCVINDDGVILTERPVKSAHDVAGKAIAEMLAAAKAENETDVDTLTERVRDIFTQHFNEDAAEDATSEAEEPSDEAEEVSSPARRRRRVAG